MALRERKLPPQKMTYQGYQINLYPYAGGFKSYIFAPEESIAIKSSPVLVGPDGAENVLLHRIIEKSKEAIDADIAARSRPEPRVKAKKQVVES